VPLGWMKVLVRMACQHMRWEANWIIWDCSLLSLGTSKGSIHQVCMACHKWNLELDNTAHHLMPIWIPWLGGDSDHSIFVICYFDTHGEHRAQVSRT